MPPSSLSLRNRCLHQYVDRMLPTSKFGFRNRASVRSLCQIRHDRTPTRKHPMLRVLARPRSMKSNSTSLNLKCSSVRPADARIHRFVNEVAVIDLIAPVDGSRHRAEVSHGAFVKHQPEPSRRHKSPRTNRPESCTQKVNLLGLARPSKDAARQAILMRGAADRKGHRETLGRCRTFVRQFYRRWRRRFSREPVAAIWRRCDRSRGGAGARTGGVLR